MQTQNDYLAQRAQALDEQIAMTNDAATKQQLLMQKQQLDQQYQQAQDNLRLAVQSQDCSRNTSRDNWIWEYRSR